MEDKNYLRICNFKSEIFKENDKEFMKLEFDTMDSTNIILHTTIPRINLSAISINYYSESLYQQTGEISFPIGIVQDITAKNAVLINAMIKNKFCGEAEFKEDLPSTNGKILQGLYHHKQK